jgi:hypothetical protein
VPCLVKSRACTVCCSNHGARQRNDTGLARRAYTCYDGVIPIPQDSNSAIIHCATAVGSAHVKGLLNVLLHVVQQHADDGEHDGGRVAGRAAAARHTVHCGVAVAQ